MHADYLIEYPQRVSTQKMLSIIVAVVVNWPWHPSVTKDDFFFLETLQKQCFTLFPLILTPEFYFLYFLRCYRLGCRMQTYL